jgi:hypothetical protein
MLAIGLGDGGRSAAPTPARFFQETGTADRDEEENLEGAGYLGRGKPISKVL